MDIPLLDDPNVNYDELGPFQAECRTGSAYRKCGTGRSWRKYHRGQVDAHG